MMYRTHCQRILDTVIRANFDEVCFFFKLFHLVAWWGWFIQSCYCNVYLCLCKCVGPELPVALLAGHAAPHAPCPGLFDSGQHSRCVWLHIVQGHLRCPHAHRPTGSAWQVSPIPAYFDFVKNIIHTPAVLESAALSLLHAIHFNILNLA